MSEDDRSSENTVGQNAQDEEATPWYTRPPWAILVVPAALLILLLPGAAILRAIVGATGFPPLMDAIAWPVFWLITLMVMLLMFSAEIRAFLRDVYALETPWLKLFRAVKAAAPQRDVPLPPPSAKQQILNEWQKVHDRLADLYEEKVGKAPPPQYRPLASRLKNQGYVTGNTGALLDEVRNIQRRVKSQPPWSVSPQLAEYYAQVVSILLELLDNAKA